MSEEEIDAKIRRIENELSDLKNRKYARNNLIEQIRKREFIHYLSKLFNFVVKEDPARSFDKSLWVVTFHNTQIRFVKRDFDCGITLAPSGLCIVDISKDGVMTYAHNNLSLSDLKLIGRILQVAEFDKLNRITQIYLDSCYPETLQSVLLILGTLKDSVFNLIGKDVTKIICQLALRGCLVK